MQIQNRLGTIILTVLVAASVGTSANALTLTNPIVFVTQPPIVHEQNGTVSNTFLSVVTEFGNHLADTAHAARGGDLWLMTTNLGLVNLTRKAGFGTNGIQAGTGIDVRDPAIHWNGKKVLFSMVIGAPTNATDTTPFFWRLYELTNLDAVIAGTNTPPVIVPVANQPTNCNNVNPTYATDGRIIFMSDRPFNNQAYLYPERDEYKGAPSVSGVYSLDPVSGDLKTLEHLPSGGFNPFIDSFGRLILTRWDHLIQDGNATDDRLGRAANGAFNFSSESAVASVQATNTLETFPEPNDFDTNYCAQLGVNPDVFNFFFPWVLDPAGGNEEIMNHVGRHEISFTTLTPSFIGDTNLFSVSNLASRAASGVISANSSPLLAFFQITEDPRTNGLYWGLNPPDISPFGGSHAAGQILTLSGGAGVNPVNMVVNPITVTNTPGKIVTPEGVYRNPLPMSDGVLIAVFTPVNTGFNFGVDTNTGTATLPVSQYQFRLMTLTNTAPFWKTNQFLTGGILNTSIFWSGSTLVTNISTVWELQPVEVRARPVPVPVVTPVAPVEQQVFAEEGVDMPTFQADLAARGVALCVSRNVTARDAADKQQPYNLSVPGGVSSIANGGKNYAITHLQFLQADYLRGYTNGPGGVPATGRRVLPVPMHTTASLNYVSRQLGAPPGGTEIMSDGSQATFIPAGRAVTWQLTGTNNNNSVVKERYWLNFRPGEVRTCANCHGINAVDQLGRPSPTNAPLALRQLLRFWKTNSANAYSLAVSNGTGGGQFGAGSILTLTAIAPGGKVFAGWQGAGVSNATAATTLFIMPTTNASVTAVFTNLPVPVFSGFQLTSGAGSLRLSAQALAGQPWILQSSTDLLSWLDVVTNYSTMGGLVQFTNIINGAPQKFYRIRSP